MQTSIIITCQLLILCLVAITSNNNHYYVNGLLQQGRGHTSNRINTKRIKSSSSSIIISSQQQQQQQQQRRQRQYQQESHLSQTPRRQNEDITTTTTTRFTAPSSSSAAAAQQQQQPSLAQIEQEIVRLGRRGRTDDALRLYHSISQPTTTIRILNSAIDACARARPTRLAQAFELLENGIREKQLEPNVFTFGSLMSACARAREADRAIQLLRSMKKDYGVTPNAIVYSSAISACSRGAIRNPKKYKVALELVQEADGMEDLELNVIGYNAALSACANAAAYEDAMQLFDIMQDKHLVDPISYGTVMAACEKAERWKEVLEYAQQMTACGLVMDGWTITSALHACQQLGLAEEGLFYLEELKGLSKSNATRHRRQTAGWERKGASRASSLNGPDGVAYRLAISACARGGQWEKGTKLLDEMEDVTGQKPDVMAYTAAITGCEYAGEWWQAFSILNEMRQQNVAPNDVTMAAVIGACATACGKQQQSSSSNNDNTNNDDKDNDDNDDNDYSSSSSSSESQLCLKKALQLLNVMKKDPTIVDPTIVVYNAAIRTCAEARELKAAFQLLNDAESRRLKPTIITYGTLMTACERAVSVEGMDQVFSLMKIANDENNHVGKDIIPNEIVYGAAISCLRKASQPERCVSMLRKMIRDGLKPNIATFNTVLKAQTEGRKPKLQNALEVYKMMRAAKDTTNNNITPNRQTFSVLIEACCARQQPQGAEAFLRLMQKSGYKPDVDLYTLTVASYEKARQPLKALRLMESMEDDGYDFYSIAPLNTAFKNAVKLVNSVVGSKTTSSSSSSRRRTSYNNNDGEEDYTHDNDEDDDDVLGDEDWIYNNEP